MPVPRLRSLDGLRGVAALAVVVHHALLAVPVLSAAEYRGADAGLLDALVYTPLHLLWAGTEAVFVFFVLSGYVLALPVIGAERFDWSAYYPSRLLRLYLPVAASVLFAFAIAVLVVRRARPGEAAWLALHAAPLDPSRALLDALLLGGTSWLNSPLWSLRWEVLFSLLLPVYVLVASRLRSRWWLVVAAVMLVETASARAGEAARFLPVFMVGVLLAVHRERLDVIANGLRRRLGRPALQGALFLAVAAGLTFQWWSFPLVGVKVATVAMPAVTTASASLLLLLALHSARLHAVLGSRPAARLGAISFSLYLVHEPIVVSVGLLLGPNRSWMTVLLAVPLALLAAETFSRVVERPSHHAAKALKSAISARARSGARTAV